MTHNSVWVWTWAVSEQRCSSSSRHQSAFFRHAFPGGRDIVLLIDGEVGANSAASFANIGEMILLLFFFMI